jgi:maleylpyruvate isomerase
MTTLRHDISTTQGWMRDGESFFASQLAALRDADLDGPSALPDWDRRRLIAHVARNAEALARLLSWAMTGVETPMYTDAAQRTHEIEVSARQPAGELRADAQRAAAALGDAAARLSDQQWWAGVRSARGREIPAAEVPWMRCREVWLHGLDLDADAVPGDIPEAFAEVLIDDVAEFMSAQSAVPETTIISTRDGRRWRIGGGASDAADSAGVRRRPMEVRGDPRALALWLTGRGYDRYALAADELPRLPSWL